MNVAFFTGRVATPFYQPGGSDKVVTFKLACNGTSFDTKAKQYVEKVDYFPFVIYGEKRVKALLENVQKGDQLSIEARPRIDSFTDKDGINRYVMDFQILQYRIGNKVKREPAFSEAEPPAF